MTQARIWLTVKDLAAQYQISENTVRNKVNSGQWPADRIPSDTGKRTLIRFSPEQQDEIEHTVRHGNRKSRKRGWLNDALTQISA